MTLTVGALQYVLSLEGEGRVRQGLQGASQDMAAAGQQADTAGQQVDGMGSDLAQGGAQSRDFGGAMKGLAGPLAVVGGAMFATAKRAADMGAEISENSQMADVSTDFYQEMGFALERLGVSQGQWDRILQRNVQRMGRAADGNQKYADAYENLGVEVTDASGNLREAEAVMTDSIVSLAGMENSAERAAAAGELFGVRAGRQLAGALDGGIESVDELREKAQELGIVLDEDAIEAANDFSDGWDDVSAAMGAIVTDIGVTLLPMLTALADLLGTVLADDMARNAVLAGSLGLAFQRKLLPRIQEAIVAAGSLRGGMSGLARSLGPGIGIAGVAAVATTVFGKFQEAQAANEAAAQRWADALEQANGNLSEASSEMLAADEDLNKLRGMVRDAGIDMGVFSDAIDGSREDLFALVAGTDGASDSYEDLAEGGNRAAQALIEARDAGDLTSEEMFRLGSELQDAAQRAEEGEQIFLDAAHAEETMGDAAGDTTEDLEELEAELEELNSELEEHLGLVREAIEDAFAIDAAERAVAESVEAATEALEESNGEMGAHSEKARAAEASVEDLIKDTADLIEAEIGLAGSTEAARDAVSRHTGALRGELQQMGLNEGQIDDLIGLLLDYDDDYLASVGLIDNATAGINQIKNAIAGLDGTTARVQAEIVGAAAAGGNFHSGGIVPGAPHQEVSAVLLGQEEVLSHDDPRHSANLGTAGVAVSSGGGTTVIELSAKDRLGQALMDALQAEVKRRGGNSSNSVQIALGSR